jgi:antitoxin component HigA of HigAB toxin-antitoxin module
MESLSPIAQLYWGTIVAWLTKDAKTPIKLKGKPAEIKAFTKVAFATKRYHEATKDPNATIQSVMDAMNAKTQAAKEFQEVMGKAWPL